MAAYDYTDEFAKQLARKRQLAALLENQSMQGINLPAPHAAGSWLNALAPMLQAYAGSRGMEQANLEGTQHEADVQRQTANTLQDFMKGFQGTAPTPDMNLPGDLSGLSGQQDQQDNALASAPPTIAPPQPQPPYQPPDQQPSSLMAKLLMQPGGGTLGGQMAQDQATPTVGSPDDIKTPLLPTGPAPPAPTPMVPQPTNVAHLNISGVSPQQAAKDRADELSDMAKSGPTTITPLSDEEKAAAPDFAPDGTPLPAIPPMPSPAATPPPSLAGPPTPGALIPTLPSGQPDMAPKGMMIPGRAATQPTIADILQLAARLPPGQQSAKFMDEALAVLAKEPDRAAQRELAAAIQGQKSTTATQNVQTRVEGGIKREEMRQEGQTSRTEMTNKSREEVAANRLAAVNRVGTPTSEVTPEAIADAAQLFRKTGVMPALGWDKDTRRKILNEWSQQGRAEGQSIDESTTAQAEFKALSSSQRQLTQRSNAIEAGAKKINNDFATLEDAIDKGNFGAPTIINTPINKLRGLVSDPDLASLKLAAQVVGVEYERMMTGGLLSIAQLHEGAREDAQKLLNGNMAPAEMRSVMATMKREIENQRNSWKDQLSDINESMKKTGNTGRVAPISPTAPTGTQVNAKGWRLMADKDGNKAYVSPDGSQYEEVK